MTEDALEAQAHNAAKCLGLIAIKSPEDVDNASNYGGFQLIDPQSHCVAGYVNASFVLNPSDAVSGLCKNPGVCANSSVPDVMALARQHPRHGCLR
jgi:hypothetical protein